MRRPPELRGSSSVQEHAATRARTERARSSCEQFDLADVSRGVRPSAEQATGYRTGEPPRTAPADSESPCLPDCGRSGPREKSLYGSRRTAVLVGRSRTERSTTNRVLYRDMWFTSGVRSLRIALRDPDRRLSNAITTGQRGVAQLGCEPLGGHRSAVTNHQDDRLVTKPPDDRQYRVVVIDVRKRIERSTDPHLLDPLNLESARAHATRHAVSSATPMGQATRLQGERPVHHCESYTVS